MGKALGFGSSLWVLSHAMSEEADPEKGQKRLDKLERARAQAAWRENWLVYNDHAVLEIVTLSHRLQWTGCSRWTHWRARCCELLRRRLMMRHTHCQQTGGVGEVHWHAGCDARSSW